MDIEPKVILTVGDVVVLNSTILWTWLVMALLVILSWLVTHSARTGREIPRGQNMLESILSHINEQIRDVSQDDPRKYLPFVGTLFLFVTVANLLTIVPWYDPPTGHLTTTAALATCVFFAVPVFGIAEKGVVGYLRHYIQPSPIMLPFNVIGEVSRTLAMAVRLFGNIMSGTLIVGVLLSVVPFLFPIIMRAFGLLVGLIQAYIFAVLAMVYIASAARTHRATEERVESQQKGRESNG